MLTFIDGEPLKAGLLLRGSTVLVETLPMQISAKLPGKPHQLQMSAKSI